jgi:hypothetical protein
MHQDVVNSGAILCLILTGVLRDGILYVIGPDQVPQQQQQQQADQ